MKGSLNDNGKISDSGYTTNTFVSQSERSSGSSLSRNSNRSESSGYCGGPTFDSSNYALPQPVSKRKDKEHKKKKSKAPATTSLADIEEKFESQINLEKQSHGTYDSSERSSDLASNCKKTEEIAGVELVDGAGLGEHNGDSDSTEPENTNTNPLDDTTPNTNVGFCVAISIKKGLNISTTDSLKTALGYTKESWIGRSFIDFIHPKDKQTFADHFAMNIAMPYGDHDNVSDTNGRQTSMYCSIRKQDEEKSSTTENASDEDNSLVATANQYVPFHLTMSIKFFRERTIDEKPRMMFLAVIAKPILPIYKAPEEMIISAIFSTRHDPSCILTHVDANVVKYFGYMPQDMIGRSLFDFYHPEDLPFIKEVYETVVKMEGSPFRSKPYRFAAQNGDYVVLETEWSSLVNPWREKLEFIVGHHRVLRGPVNPNVFQAPDDRQCRLLANISEEILKESKIIQGEIRALLDEKIQRTEDNDAYEITSRSKEFDTFVENLLQEVKPSAQNSKDRFPADGRSFSEHADSVILGAISPHHEYCDSKSSTETPPSYNQLNYNEKITRFFDSTLLVTNVYGSDEDNPNSSMPSNNDAGKTSSNLTGAKDTTLSAENLSSVSNNRTSYDRSDDSDIPRGANTMPTQSFKLATLTESVLNKHNQEMEKLLVQQHKQRRCNIKNSKKHQKGSELKDTKDKTNKNRKDLTKKRGSKRRSLDGRDHKQCKFSKYDENTQTCDVAPTTATPINPMNVDDNSPPQSRQSTNIWPSLAVTVPPSPSPYVCIAARNSGLHEPSERPRYPPFFPLYYVPLPPTREDLAQTMIPPVSSQSFRNSKTQQKTYCNNPKVSYAAATLAGVIYPPMVCAPAPVTTMYRPFVIPESKQNHPEIPQSNPGVTQQANSLDRKRSDSRATSVKAEPGSIMAISEFSKKLLSSGEHISSCVSIDGGCSSLIPNIKDKTNTNSQFESSLEDSSDSSFYGSFLTISNDSSSNINRKIVEPQETLWKPTVVPITHEDKKQLDMLRKGPPWQEGVKVTHELIYQYQLASKPLNEVLEADMKALKNFKQPQMVNEQLAQLYTDMELDGFAAKLVLDERDTSSDSESSNSGDNPRNIMPELQPKHVRNETNYTMMSMIFEENAPLPYTDEIHRD